MKEHVDSRGPNDCTQYQFDGAEFSPQNLEDTIVLLINELFEADIKAVSSVDFKYDTNTAKPIIVVESGDLKLSSTERGVKEIGFGPGAYPGSIDNGIHYEQTASGTMSLQCVARSARGTTEHVYDLLKFFQELQYFMAEMLPINMFSPTGLSKPVKVEDSEHLWKSSVSCVYKITRPWSSERIAPRLKSFGTKGVVFSEDVR